MNDIPTPPHRSYVAVKFRTWDRKTYTYHWDGEPLAAGDEVKIKDRGGDGWSRVWVASVSDAKPSFPTKPILGKCEPVAPAKPDSMFPDGAAEQ